MLVLALAGTLLWVVTGHAIWVTVFAVLAAAGYLVQAIGRSLHRGWMGLGKLTGGITGPVILTLFYILVFTPWAIATRILGPRDSLWIRRGRNSCFRSVSKEYSRRDFEKTW